MKFVIDIDTAIVEEVKILGKYHPETSAKVLADQASVILEQLRIKITDLETTVPVRKYAHGNPRDIEAFGETKNIKAWAKDPRCKVSYNTLCYRLSAGKSPEKAITEKVNRVD